MEQTDICRQSEFRSQLSLIRWDAYFSQAIAEEALHLFTRKRIRIFAHADDAGVAASDKWAAQLIDIEPASLSAWQSDTPGEDLNDFLQANHHNDEILKELIL